MKWNGVEIDEVFVVNNLIMIGWFDLIVGLIDIDFVVLLEGVYVSWKYVKIFEEDGVWKVKDFGFLNGMFIFISDFEKVDEVEFFDGMEIVFGNVCFVFYFS